MEIIEKIHEYDELIMSLYDICESISLSSELQIKIRLLITSLMKKRREIITNFIIKNNEIVNDSKLKELLEKLEKINDIKISN